MKRLCLAASSKWAIAQTAFVLVMTITSLPVSAQDNLAEARLRRMEAEIRALQRQVFPGTDGKVFSPEITQQAAATPAAGQPATTPMTDMLARMDALESQVARLTAQAEQNANHLAQIEARLAPPPAVEGPAAAALAPAATATTTNAVQTPAAPQLTAAPPPAAQPPAAQPPAAQPPAALPPKANVTAPVAAASQAPRSASATVARSATPAAPSAQRVAAVRAIVKPQTEDPGEDEYNYGFRLWDAKFYPEAQQQLKLMVDKYPRHALISHARNLLGRAFLDDGKPREAAQWFLQNYNADKAGERAPDSLLYLAESMRRLNDTSRACIALAEFGESYSREAAGRLKTQYDQTRSTVKCN